MKTKTCLTKILALVLCVPMLLALAVPAFASGGRIEFNTSYSPCTGNLSVSALPSDVSNASVGRTIYINVAATSDIRLKSIEVYVSVNGGDYTLAGRETARNYMRWAAFSYQPSAAGTLTILARVYFLNGSYSQGTNTIKVSDPSSAPAASFSPVWPAQSANYVSTLYYYWNGGRPSAHSTRSNRYNAIDIAGSGNILAAEAGTVVSAGWNGGFGNCVIIRHDNGLYSLYGHMANLSVYAGQSVYRGQVIGVMGSTGNSTGRHLHFELYDPSNYAQVINPWANYFQGNVSVVVGGNSRRANASFPDDAASRAWVSYLDTYGRLNGSGDYQLG